MKVVVACRCGQHFATDRRHLGKTVRCLACQAPLIIAEAAAPAPPPFREPEAAKPAGIRVRCACGWAFQAPNAYEGRQLHCPGCHAAVIVPYSDPLALGNSGSTVVPSPDTWLSPIEPTSEFSDKLALRLAYIAGGSVALLALGILVTASINSMRGPREESVVAEVTRELPSAASPSSAAVEKKSQAQSLPPAPSYVKTPAPVPPMPQPEVTPSVAGPLPAAPIVEESPPASVSAATRVNQTPKPVPSAPSSRAAKVGEPQSSGDLTMTRLPEASQAWLEQGQAGAQLLGIRRVGTTTNPGAHFSWMTGLLPFLDHKQVYDRIDFNKPVTTSGNLTVGTTIIPEFVNPHDDRQRWKGHPLDGLALAHFAGMSGVEDSRNVVAAKLPRSDPRAGVFGYDEVARAKDITDGTGQTIMMVGTGAMANPWITGGGGTIRGAREPLFDNITGLGMKGLAGGGTLAVMADGSVRHVTGNVDPRVFKAMCTIHGAESVDLEGAAAPFAREEWKASRRATPKSILPGRRGLQP